MCQFSRSICYWVCVLGCLSGWYSWGILLWKTCSGWSHLTLGKEGKFFSSTVGPEALIWNRYSLGLNRCLRSFEWHLKSFVKSSVPHVKELNIWAYKQIEWGRFHIEVLNLNMELRAKKYDPGLKQHDLVIFQSSLGRFEGTRKGSQEEGRYWLENKTTIAQQQSCKEELEKDCEILIQLFSAEKNFTKLWLCWRKWASDWVF